MASQSPETRDKYDMTQSTETWANFLAIAKWSIIVSVITLLLMALFLTGSNPAP